MEQQTTVLEPEQQRAPQDEAQVPVPQPPRQQPRVEVVRELPVQRQQTADERPAAEWPLHSPEIDQIVAALAKASLAFGEIYRSRTAEVKSRREGAKGYEYNYEDFGDLIDAVRDPLAQNGLVLLQFPSVGYREQRVAVVTVVTMLCHTSGQWFRNRLTVLADSADPQGIGSATSYARRYGEKALLNLAPTAQEDDDGARASGQGSQASQPPQAGARKSQQPSNVGPVRSVEDVEGGAIVTLETGYRAGTRDPEMVKALHRHKKTGDRVELTCRPAKDPRYAPVLVEVSVVADE